MNRLGPAEWRIAPRPALSPPEVVSMVAFAGGGIGACAAYKLAGGGVAGLAAGAITFPIAAVGTGLSALILTLNLMRWSP